MNIVMIHIPIDDIQKYEGKNKMREEVDRDLFIKICREEVDFLSIFHNDNV